MPNQTLREAFSKVKQDVKDLKAKFEAINTKLDKLLDLKERKIAKNEEFEGIKPSKSQIQEISSGNEGVQSINHSTITQQSLTNHSLTNHSILSKDTPNISLNRVEDRFKSITNQEFLVFLTVYNLEEQLGRGITYDDVSSRLSLTTSCIRSYVSSILKKGIPIVKFKANNRTTNLKINPHFRSLNLKEGLTKMYLKQDPSQTTLF